MTCRNVLDAMVTSYITIIISPSFVHDNHIGNVPMNGVRYSGFPLYSPTRPNVYMWTTLAECQYLCHITSLCFYFNWQKGKSTLGWSPPAGLGSCWLSYGVGKKHQDSTNTFGHKDTAGAAGEDRSFGGSSIISNLSEGQKSFFYIFLLRLADPLHDCLARHHPPLHWTTQTLEMQGQI